MKPIKIGRFIKLVALIVAGSLLALLAKTQFPGSETEILVVWIFYALFVSMGVFLNWYLRPKREETVQKDVIDIFIKIASSVLLIASLAVAWLSLQVTQRLSREALDSNRKEMRATRFMSALEKLGGETSYHRWAGVVAFQKLDEELEKEWQDTNCGNEDNPEAEEVREKVRQEHWLITGILTNFIRAQVKWPERSSNADTVDVFAAFKLLSRRKLNSAEPDVLDLSQTNLSGYILSRDAITVCTKEDELNFEQVNFSKSNLQEIELKCAKLKGANFKGSNLTRARLDYADLTDVDLTEADLRGALMGDANCGECETLKYAVTDASTRCPLGFANESDKCVRVPTATLTPTSSPTPTPTPTCKNTIP